MLLGRRRRALLTFPVLLTVVALGLASPARAVPAQASGALVGTFRLTAGACSNGATGSYFRMILPTGTQQGPWIDNADSTCADHTYTLLAPGTDGGLVTGGYQPAPDPGFDADGNSLANRLLRPVRFFGVAFSASTNPTDLQTRSKVPAPTLRADGGKLTGELSAFAATWNKQAFNQGSPKPDGSRPGNTTAPSGTYDAASGHFTLTWTSQIVGGPFNNFTGQWHLEGTFVPAAAGAATQPAAGAGGATATTAPAAATTVAQAGTPTNVSAGASTTVARSSSDEVAAPAGTVVHDDGFEAPVWLVVLLAAAGIGGVLALLVLAPRRTRAPIEGA